MKRLSGMLCLLLVLAAAACQTAPQGPAKPPAQPGTGAPTNPNPNPAPPGASVTPAPTPKAG
ncbi:MAG TPA: hypothetical protein VKG01_13790 [Thermoanaerobaculia bacterium]|nr:hypothetical protein [Thermoanaerobaculia bacterium]